MTNYTAGRTRLEAIVKGETPDRPPVTFWRHFYNEENDPESLAQAMLRFHHEFGWDWIKLNPRASYHVEDWGYRYNPSDDPLVKPEPVTFPVQTPGDWAKIEPLDPSRGVLAEHLQAIRKVVSGAGGDPVLMTLFSPLSVAGDLVPDEARLVKHLREAPESVESALEAITQTFERFAEEVLNAGADGLFFATTEWGTADTLSFEEYQKWGRLNDLRVLNRVQQAPLNLLHVCQPHNFLAELSDYPVPLLNWGFDDPGNVSVEAGLEQFDKAVIGGVSRMHDLIDATPRQVYDKVVALKSALAGKRWGCGPDCSIRAVSRVDNLRAVKAAIEGKRL